MPKTTEQHITSRNVFWEGYMAGKVSDRSCPYQPVSTERPYHRDWWNGYWKGKGYYDEEDVRARLAIGARLLEEEPR